MDEFIAIIPSRYASTRFEGKPLVDIFGKTMIERVYTQTAKCFKYVVVATDDQRIFDAVTSFGGEVVMTSTQHRSGTDRCKEALCKAQQLFNRTFSYVVNVQGDEPFIDTTQLTSLVECFNDKECQIATLVKPFEKDENIFNENSPKVVLSKEGYALYFSRSVIPFLRGVEREKWQEKHQYYKHIGLYGYRSEVLEQITNMPCGTLEAAENLEQLRWLENGLKIKTAVTHAISYAIDTPKDLEVVINQFKTAQNV